MRCFRIGTVIMMVIVSGAFAGTTRAEATDDQAVTMKQVVVTASREKEAIAKVPANVTVITAEDIRDSTAFNVPELLDTEGGIHVSDITGSQRYFNVDIRGFGEAAPANLLVQVDGRRVTQPDLSGTDWAQIPLERIERIEIIRGSRGSVLYGSNTTAGVINIITKEGRKSGGDVTFTGGSYHTYNGSASADLVSETSALNIFGSYLDTDGYRDHSGTEAKDTGIKMNYDPTDHTHLYVSGGYHKDDTNLPGYLSKTEIDQGRRRTDTDFPDDFANTEDYYVSGGGRLEMLTDDSFSIDAGYRQRKSEDRYISFGSEANSDIKTFNISPKLTFNGDFGEVSNRVILGWDYYNHNWDIDNRSTFTGSLKSKLELESTGYYIQDDLGITPKITLSGGYRYDRTNYKVDPDPTWSAAQPAGEAIKSDEAYSMGINYAFGGSSHLYFNYSRSFRYPLLDEVYDRFTNTYNLNLVTQDSDAFETGFMVDFTKNIRLGVNLFDIKTENEIYYDLAMMANTNLDGETRRRGFEVSIRYAKQGLSFGGNYTYANARILSGAYSGKWVPNVPESSASADIGYSWPIGIKTKISGTYVGSRYAISDPNNDGAKLDSYTVVNARVKYDWQWLTLFVNFNNIFNEEYYSYGIYNSSSEENLLYPSAEFNVLAGIKTHFGGK